MSVSWNKEYTPALIIEKLESTRQIRDDGKVQFVGWGYKEFATLLYSMLNFPDDMPEIEARRIVSDAIFNSGSKGVITNQNILSEVNKLEREYQDLPVRRYALASSISLNPHSALRSIKLNDNLVIFESCLPQKFTSEAKTLLANTEEFLFAKLPVDYLQVRIHLSAKSVHDAANQALETIDFIRGIWNLGYNRSQSFRMSWGGKPKPVNHIILGPLHSLHKPNGQLAATNNWWFEPSYLGAIEPLSIDQDKINAMYKTLDHVKKKLRKHKYAKNVQNAFIRYTRALDERNWAVSFLKLWGVLEFLTDTIGGSYDLTIKRAAFVFQEHEYYWQILQHLRKYRNNFVHFDRENSEVETYLYQLKNCVEALLQFHMNNKFEFDSIQDAASFLSLPYDKKSLDNKIDKIQFAKKFRGFS